MALSAPGSAATRDAANSLATCLSRSAGGAERLFGCWHCIRPRRRAYASAASPDRHRRRSEPSPSARRGISYSSRRTTVPIHDLMHILREQPTQTKIPGAHATPCPAARPPQLLRLRRDGPLRPHETGRRHVSPIRVRQPFRSPTRNRSPLVGHRTRNPVPRVLRADKRLPRRRVSCPQPCGGSSIPRPLHDAVIVYTLFWRSAMTAMSRAVNLGNVYYRLGAIDAVTIISAPWTIARESMTPYGRADHGKSAIVYERQPARGRIGPPATASIATAAGNDRGGIALGNCHLLASGR